MTAMTPPSIINISSDEEDEIAFNVAIKTQGRLPLGASNKLSRHQQSSSGDPVATNPHTTQNTALPRAKSMEAPIRIPETTRTRRAMSALPPALSQFSRAKDQKQEPEILGTSAGSAAVKKEKPVSELVPPERSFSLSRNPNNLFLLAAAKLSEAANKLEEVEERARSTAKASRKRKTAGTTVGSVKKSKISSTSVPNASTTSATSNPLSEMTTSPSRGRTTTHRPAPLSAASTPPAPPIYQSREWSLPQIGYFVLAVKASFNAEGFAAAHNKTVEEVDAVFSAMVSVPLYRFNNMGVDQAKTLEAFYAGLDWYTTAFEEMWRRIMKEEAEAEAKAMEMAKAKAKEMAKAKAKAREKARELAEVRAEAKEFAKEQAKELAKAKGEKQAKAEGKGKGGKQVGVAGKGKGGEQVGAAGKGKAKEPAEVTAKAEGGGKWKEQAEAEGKGKRGEQVKEKVEAEAKELAMELAMVQEKELAKAEGKEKGKGKEQVEAGWKGKGKEHGSVVVEAALDHHEGDGAEDK